MGERRGVELSVRERELEAFSVDTPGGRIDVRWDYEASATPNAQLAFSRSCLPPPGCMSLGWKVARSVIAAATPPTSETFLEPGFFRFWQGTDVMLTLPGCGAMESVRRSLE